MSTDIWETLQNDGGPPRLAAPSEKRPTQRGKTMEANEGIEPPKMAQNPKKGKRKFVFRRPPAAPVYTPTQEEFEDPLKYISKIRPSAEKYGICKIIPPAEWKPPFALDYDEFKFTPRIQRINELEAKTRIKLNFLDQIAKFWALQGSPLKIPVLGKQVVDLYTLHRLVQDEGGPEKVSKEKSWNKIACKMGYPGKGTILRGHYDHILYPFDIFQKENLSNGNKLKSSKINSEQENNGRIDRTDSINVDVKKCLSYRELRSLQFLGPGPKMAVCSINLQDAVKSRTRGKKVLYNFDPLAKYMCKTCCNDDLEESLVICERCDDKYHTTCLTPPLSQMPKNGWSCPKCVAAEVCKPLEEFGFAQAQQEYTLTQFGQMANEFKKKYFKAPCTSVPLTQVENEFWRVVSSIDESVTVEYGADLHTMDHGSGFPTKKTLQNCTENIEELRFYADSKWNLNNFPVLKGSALRHISADISGMKIPWVYVGMCFATFCWHNEDHWSYSINYLHWGEPKTWYGVPGCRAEDFEASMKSAAPELFYEQPDLLHQLVTILNPNVLMAAGVPVCRTDQMAGEFVVTFPRAYHAGFNQGFNMAEACNFAPSDWLRLGRDCISHYASVRRFCVFSHDELICKMAEIYRDLDDQTLLATYKDFHSMLIIEQKKRKYLKKLGVTEGERGKFDEMTDDERQCDICKTTCFLSAVFCECDPSRLVCLDHCESLCKCPPNRFKLKYHFRLDELMEMFMIVKQSAENFDSWLEKVNATFTKKNARVGLRAFCDLRLEAKEKEFPQTEFMDYFDHYVRLCLGYATVARALVSKVLSKEKSPDTKKPTVAELVTFKNELDDLPCILTEVVSVNNILKSAKKFQAVAQKNLKNNIVNSRRLEACINLGHTLNIDFNELGELEKKYDVMLWYEKATKLMGEREQLSIDELNAHLEIAPCEGTYEEVDCTKQELIRLLHTANEWKMKFESTISSDPSPTIEDLESLLIQGENNLIFISEWQVLSDLIINYKQWVSDSKLILNNKLVLNISELQAFLRLGLRFPIQTAFLEELKDCVQTAEEWVDDTSSLILKDDDETLFQVLWPRYFRSRRHAMDMPHVNRRDPIIMHCLEKDYLYSSHLEAEKLELTSLMNLRVENLRAKSEDGSYCILCGTSDNGKMVVRCELCLTEYHEHCVNERTAHNETHRSVIAPKLLCDYCLRTGRPSLKGLLEAKKNSDSLKIKVAEAELLKYHIRRIIRWVKSANKVLSKPEVKSSLSNILKCSGIKKAESESKEVGIKIEEINIPHNYQPPVESNIRTKWVGINKKVLLSPSDIIELKQLMTMGDLLEVGLRATLEIWILLQVSSFEFQWRFMSEVERWPLPIVEIDIAARPLKKIKKKCKDVKEQVPEAVVNPLPQKGPGKRLRAGSEGGKRKKILKPNLVTKSDVAESGVSRKMEMDVERGEEEEEEVAHDICASSNCLKPPDAELDWVQCDGKCGLWFHMRCVDLNKQDITEEDEYICLQCLSKENRGLDEIEVTLDHVRSLQPAEIIEMDPLM